MKIDNIYYSTHFAHTFKKLPGQIQEIAAKKEKFFRKNCFDEKLKTHKLKGKLKGYWAFSITRQYRILFQFLENGVGFIDIGPHSIYR